MATATDTLAPAGLRAQGTSCDRPSLGRETEVIRLRGLTGERPSLHSSAAGK